MSQATSLSQTMGDVQTILSCPWEYGEEWMLWMESSNITKQKMDEIQDSVFIDNY